MVQELHTTYLPIKILKYLEYTGRSVDIVEQGLIRMVKMRGSLETYC